MGLYDRLTGRPGDDGDAEGEGAGAPSTMLPPPPASNGSSNGQPSGNGLVAPQAPIPSPTTNSDDDYLSDLRRRTHLALVKAMGPALYDPSTSTLELERQVRSKLGEVIAADSTPLSQTDRQKLIETTIDDILGYGPIEPLLNDRTVTEVMCNGPDAVYIEREGKLVLTDTKFLDDGHLRRTIEKIVGEVGRRIDESSPYVDARLPDGSRVNAVIPPVSLDGPMLTIRKFSPEAYGGQDLVNFGTWSPKAANFLAACVSGKTNLLVSGGTGAGKTTTLNVLSSYIPLEERIVTIEDAAELQLGQPHVVRMEYRPPNIEGRGEVTIRDLVRNSLRMRPDRIVVGEVRGGEALDMLQAMNTGHDGSISTIHANSPRDALSRLETMVLMAGVDLPVRAIREQIAAGVQFIAHQSRFRDGSRKITRVSEITGMEGDVITMQDIFEFDWKAGTDEATGKARGKLEPTGIRPSITDHLRDLGVQVSVSWFAPDDEMAVR
ncbi:ATPase, T2SS/T4P/T4SS family [Salsipaludibacter albus]|uniref:CpaF family protein n=1 Tax=Salsipaludibacter albus TaxID=2849650 RepID=UPI001EE40FC4|nr:Flp pilus assembly complex ATPase component TadA [Salsipaludibacter albus]